MRVSLAHRSNSSSAPTRITETIQCTSINASRDFFQWIGTSEHSKQFIELPGAYHELLVEPEVDHVMASLNEFATSAGKQFAGVEGVTNADGTVTLKLNS